MSKLITFIVFLMISSQGLHSQTLKTEIRGILTNNVSYKYAYLFIPETNNLIKKPIISDQFNITISKVKGFLTGFIFLGQDSLLTFTDIQKVENLNHVSKFIAIENLEITIDYHVKDAIVKGEIYNKELDEMNQVLVSGDYASFFKVHDDSPVALLLLEALIQIRKRNIMGMEVNPLKYFNLLSDRIKKTKEGKKILLLIN